MCDKYRTFRDAEIGFAERQLILENRYIKIEVQIKFLHSVWSALPARLQLNLSSILSIINTKLGHAIELLDQVIDKKESHNDHGFAFNAKGKVRRGAFALTLRDSIDTTIRDLDQWQENLLGMCLRSLSCLSKQLLRFAICNKRDICS